MFFLFFIKMKNKIQLVIIILSFFSLVLLKDPKEKKEKKTIITISTADDDVHLTEQNGQSKQANQVKIEKSNEDLKSNEKDDSEEEEEENNKNENKNEQKKEKQKEEEKRKQKEEEEKQKQKQKEKEKQKEEEKRKQKEKQKQKEEEEKQKQKEEEKQKQKEKEKEKEEEKNEDENEEEDETNNQDKSQSEKPLKSTENQTKKKYLPSDQYTIFYLPYQKNEDYIITPLGFGTPTKFIPVQVDTTTYKTCVISNEIEKNFNFSYNIKNSTTAKETGEWDSVIDDEGILSRECR